MQNYRSQQPKTNYVQPGQIAMEATPPYAAQRARMAAMRPVVQAQPQQQQQQQMWFRPVAPQQVRQPNLAYLALIRRLFGG